MNNKVGLGVILLIILLLAAPLFADDYSLGVSTMTISGTVGPRSIIGVASVLGQGDIPANAIPLDSGDILATVEGMGVKVGEWEFDSNSAATLKLYVDYDDFVSEDDAIPYVVYNGNRPLVPIYKEALFAELVRNGGIYRPEDNKGDIYIKRTDTKSYAPSNQYETTIQFTISTE